MGLFFNDIPLLEGEVLIGTLSKSVSSDFFYHGDVIANVYLQKSGDLLTHISKKDCKEFEEALDGMSSDAFFSINKNEKVVRKENKTIKYWFSMEKPIELIEGKFQFVEKQTEMVLRELETPKKLFGFKVSDEGKQAISYDDLKNVAKNLSKRIFNALSVNPDGFILIDEDHFYTVDPIIFEGNETFENVYNIISDLIL
jgi:hypothetical protein